MFETGKGATQYEFNLTITLLHFLNVWSVYMYANPLHTDAWFSSMDIDKYYLPCPYLVIIDWLFL